MLTPSSAEDKDVLAVTEATADKYKLTKISDLAPVAGELVLGGPPEWKTRVQGVVGLRDVYGLNFKDFVSSRRRRHLDDDGADQRSDSGRRPVQHRSRSRHATTLSPLRTTSHLFAAENVVPLIKTAKQNDTDHEDARRRVGEAHHRGPHLDERRGRDRNQPF